jgi:hypothetical protein
MYEINTNACKTVVDEIKLEETIMNSQEWSWIDQVHLKRCQLIIKKGFKNTVIVFQMIHLNMCK